MQISGALIKKYFKTIEVMDWLDLSLTGSQLRGS